MKFLIFCLLSGTACCLAQTSVDYGQSITRFYHVNENSVGMSITVESSARSWVVPIRVNFGEKLNSQQIGLLRRDYFTKSLSNQIGAELMNVNFSEELESSLIQKDYSRITALLTNRLEYHVNETLSANLSLSIDIIGFLNRQSRRARLDEVYESDGNYYVIDDQEFYDKYSESALAYLIDPPIQLSEQEYFNRQNTYNSARNSNTSNLSIGIKIRIRK